MAGTNHTRISRKQAMPMKEVISMYIKSMRLTAGLNSRCVFSAWNDASGAEQFTLKKFFRDGKLYVTLSSSVIRNQLSFQKDAILEKMNAIISENELYTCVDGKTDFVEELILK